MLSTRTRLFSAWRDWYLKYDRQVALEFYKTAIPFMKIEEARRILDVGAGTGEGAELMLSKADSQASFVLSTKHDFFVDEIEKRSLPRCEIILTDHESFDFPGEFFDRILQISTITRVHSPMKFFREAYRLLVPGGLLSFSALGSRNGSSRNEVLDMIREEFGLPEPFLSRTDLSNPGVLKNHLKNVGFSKIVSLKEYYHYPANSAEDLMPMFLEDPAIKQICDSGKQKQVEDMVRNELNKILKGEETTLNYECHLMIAIK